MTPADLVAIMVFQNGASAPEARSSPTIAPRCASVIQDLEVEADGRENGAGVTFDTGGAFGEDDDTFNLFSTDRQLAALQTAVTGLGPLPEVKTLVYFGSGLRLNGADNQAQLRATVNAAVRANVTINPIDTRGLVADAAAGRCDAGVARRRRHVLGRAGPVGDAETAAVAGHLLRAGEGHRRPRDVRQQRSRRCGIAPGGAGGDRLLHDRLLHDQHARSTAASAA